MSAQSEVPAGRFVALAAACGATAGLLTASFTLFAQLPLAPGDVVSIAALAVSTYALLSAAVASVWAVARRRLHPTVAVGIAFAVLVAAWRARALLGRGELGLVLFATGPLLEGALIGCLGSIAAARMTEKLRRRIGWSFVAVALSALLVVGGRAPLAGLLAAPFDGPPRPNLLLVSVDTLRADHLGAYGGPPGLTPELDRLAATGVTFLRAASPIALTGPSHATMLTGLDPVRHGAVRNGVALDGDVATVVETFASAGYRTAGFASAWTLSHAATGLGARFLHWDEDFSERAWWPGAADVVPLLWLVDRAGAVALRWLPTGGDAPLFVAQQLERSGDRTVGRALDWIARDRARPFFAFVHLFEPHRPYAPPPARLQALPPSPAALDRLDLHEPRLGELVADAPTVERIRALYRAEVATADAQVGRLLAGLDRLGRASDTIVVFTSDHGEGLGEHGEWFDHGDFVYETTAHVPLLVHWPTGEHAGRRVDGLVRLSDVAPTLLAMADLAVPGDLDGRSLLPILAGTAGAEVERALGSSDPRGRRQTVRYSSRTRRFKLIWTVDERGLVGGEPALEELYDLETDPGESRNLLREGRIASEVVEPLREALRLALRETRSSGGRLDPQAAEQLRSLGYL